MFGFTESQISEFGLTWGVGLLIAFMLFIVWDLARQSKAGKAGTFWLFLVLGLGMLTFAIKFLIKWAMGI